MLLAGCLTHRVILNLYYGLMMLYHHLVPTAPAALSLRIPLFSYFNIWFTATRQNGYLPPRVLQCQKHTFFLNQLTLQFLGAFAKLRKVTISFVVSVCPSVHPHGTTRLPLGGLWWNLIFEYFSKICREISSFIEIWQELRELYTKAYIHLLSYLAQLFLEWETFQTKL